MRFKAYFFNQGACFGECCEIQSVTPLASASALAWAGVYLQTGETTRCEPLTDTIRNWRMGRFLASPIDGVVVGVAFEMPSRQPPQTGLPDNETGQHPRIPTGIILRRAHPKITNWCGFKSNFTKREPSVAVWTRTVPEPPYKNRMLEPSACSVASTITLS